MIIDWATVGPGPVGHDVGVLLIDQATTLRDALPEQWEQLVTTYAEALGDAGSRITVAEVERSVAIQIVDDQIVPDVRRPRQPRELPGTSMRCDPLAYGSVPCRNTTPQTAVV